MTERPTYIPQRFQFFWRALSIVITVGTVLIAVIVAMNSDDYGTRETQFVVLGIFAMLAFASAILSRNLHGWTGDFLQGVSTEMIGAILSGFIILIVVGAAEDRELRASLIRDAGSPDHTTAINAVYELRDRGLLLGEEGLLENASMDRTDLHRADLSNANLIGVSMNDAILNEAVFSEADLTGADLTGADLSEAQFTLANLQSTELDRTTSIDTIFARAALINANLERSDLQDANFQRADLSGANLSRADLSDANLRETTLTGANLAGAILSGTDFKGANLQGVILVVVSGNNQLPAVFDEDTILPNGKHYDPTGDNPLTQLAEFGAIINPQEPDGY